MRLEAGYSRISGIIFLLFLSGLLFSCSGASREKVLKFLFDEPPAPKAVADTARVSAAAEEKPKAPSPPVARTLYVLHPPYAERECGSCHALRASKTFRAEVLATSLDQEGRVRHPARLIEDKETLCYECHDDKSPESLEEQGAYLHGPTAAGECTACHDPHRTKYESLLKKGDPVANLCFSCHEKEDVLAVDVHEDVIEDGECTLCHDPHASSEEFLLR